MKTLTIIQYDQLSEVIRLYPAALSSEGKSVKLVHNDLIAEYNEVMKQFNSLQLKLREYNVKNK